MCPKCHKTHAADTACAVGQQRTAAQILTDLEAGIRAGADFQKTCADQLRQMDERLKAHEIAAKKRSAGVSLPGVELEKTKFSFQRLIIALANKRPDLAPFEMSVCDETNKKSGRELNEDGTVSHRDLSTDIDSAGGYLVPNQVSNELIELQRAALVTGALGVTRMDGMTGGAFDINAQTGGATAYDVAEGAAISASQQTFAQKEMRPRELAAMTKLSNRLLRQSNAEAVVRNDLVQAISLAHDLRILQGGGGLQALGIVNTPGISARTLGTAPTADAMYNMIYDVEKENLAKGSLGFAFHPRSWNTIRQLKDGEGRYILTGGLSAPAQQPSARGTLLGYPFVTTTQIPITLGAGAASRIYFGNWADVLLATWANIEIAASNETSDAFAKRQTWVRICTEYDCLLKHAKSFCVDSTIL